MTGPCTITLVSTETALPSTETAKRSRPRGAGPPRFSPTRLYFDPWHGHSNHCEVWHQGTRHPRCTHFWYSATYPCSIPARIGGTYCATLLAFGMSAFGYGWMYTFAA